MKYNIHVGDYAETKDGDVGYVTKIKYIKGLNDENYCDLIVKLRSGQYICHEYPTNLCRYFNRIGLYDFTKITKVKNKIKFLDSECDVTDCINKINELIEAANELAEE